MRKSRENCHPNLTYFLGMSIVQTQEEKETNTEKLLTRMGCKPVKTPVDPDNHLVKAAKEEVGVNQKVYQIMVGGLM